MSIKAGAGKGGGGRKKGIKAGGESGSPRRQMQVPAPKPYSPTENTFPEKDEFRLGTYRVVEELDDYLICMGFDPNAKNPFAEITPAAFRKIKVAKPLSLQRTPWDGNTFDIGGIEYTYEYSDDEFGVRTASWTDDEGDAQEEEQRIYIPYVVEELEEKDRIITAVELRKSAVVDGMDVDDEQGARLTWMDLNVSGRHWKGTDEDNAKTLIVGTLQGALSEGGSQTVDVTVGGDGTETVYERVGLGSNNPLVAGTTVAADWAKGLGYVVVAARCPE